MGAIDDREQLQEKIYQDYSRDGAGETLMGIGLLWGSMGMGMMHGPWMPLMPVILVLVGRAWKKRITYPRLGYAEIVAKKRTSRRQSMLLIVLTVLLVLALMYRAFLPYTHGGPIPHEKLALGACVAAIIAGAGIALRLKSVWVVAVLMLGFFAVADYLHLHAGWAIGTAGVMMLVLGLLRLRRFVRDNPVLETTP